MNITYEQVRHHRYGLGKVIEQTLTAIIVQFGDEYGKKKFLYPSAFESFLELCSPAVKEQMEGELQQIRDQVEAERKRCEDEDEKYREGLRRVLCEQKKAAAKKCTPVKKAPAKSPK